MIKSNKYRQAAKGQQCTINIAGVCNYQEETVVFCHFPDSSNGMGIKSDDISGADCCSACHDAIDSRVKSEEFDLRKDYYLRRAQTRTIKRRLEQGLLTLK